MTKPKPKPETSSGVSHKASGQTKPVQGENPAPRLPHERDESADSQREARDTSAASVITPSREAFTDAAKKQPDTGPAPVMDKAYSRQKKAS